MHSKILAISLFQQFATIGSAEVRSFVEYRGKLSHSKWQPLLQNSFRSIDIVSVAFLAFAPYQLLNVWISFHQQDMAYEGLSS